MANDEVVIRRIGTSDVYVGSGEKIPDGFELVGPAEGVGKIPVKYLTEIGMQPGGFKSTDTPTTRSETQTAKSGSPLDAVSKLVGFDAGGVGTLASDAAMKDPKPQGSMMADLKALGGLTKQAAMPTIGAIGGGMLGSRLGMPGRVAGESIGSGLGTAANMATGVEPWSLNQLGLATGIGPAMRAIGGLGGAALSAGAKMLPGSAVARHEMGKSAMEGLGPGLAPAQASGPLYQQVAGMNPSMFVPNTEQVTREIASQINKNPLSSLTSPGLKSLVSDLQGWMGSVTKLAPGAAGPPVPPTVHFENMWEATKSLRAKIQDGLKDGSIPWGQAIQVRKAMLADLESAAQQPGSAASLLKTANDSFKKEVASDTLGDVVRLQGLATRQVGKDTVMELKPVKILEYMRKDPDDIMRLLDKSEREAITATLKEITRNSPRLPPAEGGTSPFRQAGRLLTGAALGGGAAYSSGSVGPAAYAMSTAGAAIAYQAMNTVEKALMTETGRKLLVSAMKHGPFLDHSKIAALAIAMRSPMFAEDTPEAAGPTPDEKKILKAAQ